jgi:hypothetical protein
MQPLGNQHGRARQIDGAISRAWHKARTDFGIPVTATFEINFEDRNDVVEAFIRD